MPDAASAANRRDVLKIGAAALALGVMRLKLPTAAGAQEAARPTADLCLLTPEQTEGPYDRQLELIREKITEDRSGIPRPEGD